jgi:putative effector of murein hydrolase
VALAIVVPALPIAERVGVSPNVAAIAAVVVGLLVGARLAEMVAKAWGLPEDEK